MPDNENLPKKALENTEQESAPVSSKRKPKQIKNSANGAVAKRKKGNNTFFPDDHGLMITKIGHRDGHSVPAIQKLHNSLASSYGLDDPIDALMIELAVVDYWRLGQGHEAEKRLIEYGRYVFEPQGTLPTIIRYNEAARRNLVKSLQLLQENAETPESDSKFLEDGFPDKIDPRDFLSESDFDGSRPDLWDEEAQGKTQEDGSDDKASTTSPMQDVNNVPTVAPTPEAPQPGAPETTGEARSCLRAV